MLPLHGPIYAVEQCRGLDAENDQAATWVTACRLDGSSVSIG